MNDNLSDLALHEYLDEEHTQALLTNYSGDYEVWLEEKVAALRRRVKRFDRFKLYLEVMGGIDVDHAWGATEREEEL